jgi:predicted RNA-binding protein YlxR (DUF448 family)
VARGVVRRAPSRTCVSCRTTRDKRDLVRVVRMPDGQVVLDPTGRVAGRGAYLCADGSCWRAAIDKNIIARALRVTLPDELRERLEAGPAATPIHDQGGARGQE